MIICGGSAIPRLIDFAAFREICDEVGAIMMVDAAHFIGLVAGKAIPSPVPYADVVTFTTHKVLRGPRGGAFVCKAEHAAALDKAAFPMMQGGPLMHAVAAKAVNLKECLQPEYQAYARQVIANAQALTEGLAAEGLRPVAGGTDTHLALLDLQETGVTGADAEKRCDAAGIVLNKNAIPFDPQPASIASGIRVGSPAVTTQGMVETDMKEIASLIGTAIRDADGSRTAEVAAGVRELVGAHPAYPEPHARRLTDARVRRRPAHRGAGHLPDHARGADGGDPLPDDGRPAGAGRARHPDAAGRRRGHVPRGGRRHPRGHPAPGAAADLRRLADLRRAGRRRADLPARACSTTSGAWTRSPSSPARSPRPA